MTHFLDPARLPDANAYAAALDELDALLFCDPGSPGGRRLDEIVALIEEYEARRDGYDLAQMRQMLADSG